MGVAEPLVSTILNASAAIVKVLVVGNGDPLIPSPAIAALLAVLIKPNPETWPLLSILTAYLPWMPSTSPETD